MSESRAIIARQPAGEIDLVHSLEDVSRIATFVAQSKLFGGINPAEAVVKIIAGREMGFGAIQSMSSIHIIEGKPSPGADLIAAALRRKGSGYDFEINEISDNACKITFYRYQSDGSKKEIGSLRYTYEEAKAKGWNLTQKGTEKMPWRTKTANMLFARVITDGKRFFAPDVLTSTFDRDEIDSPAFESLSSVQVATTTDSSRRPTPFHNGGPAFDPSQDAERATDLTVNEDGSLSDPHDEMQAVRNRIDAYARELGITPERMRKKLQKDYGGVDSIHAIHDLAALKMLEAELSKLEMTRKGLKGAAASASA